VAFGLPMVRFQTDVDIRIARADRRGSGVRRVDAAVRNADVVDDGFDLARRNDAANGGLDAVAERRGLLDAHASRGAQVQLDLAAIDNREEVLAETREKPPEREGEQRRSRHRADKRQREAVAGGEGAREQGLVALPDAEEPPFEAALQALREVAGRAGVAL